MKFVYIVLGFSVHFLILTGSIFGQNKGTISGSLIQSNSDIVPSSSELLLINANTKQLQYKTSSTEFGTFIFENVEYGDYILEIYNMAYNIYSQPVSHQSANSEVGQISIIKSGSNVINETNDLPTINLNDQELSDDGRSAQDVSGLLSASRDIFVSPASFAFTSSRFRFRGLPYEYNNVYVNGVLTNDLEDGTANFSEWGGLNDVFRNREFVYGLAPSSYSLGDFGSATYLDARASKQRKGHRLSYSLANRTYSHRLMYTYSSGLNEKGWAYSVSGSRRWAQEGYVAGSYYDAWAYYVSVDKRFNEKHTLSLTAFGAPIDRGVNSPAVKEMFELSGDKYYNPNWGPQDGGKRNSRLNRVHQPMVILKHNFTVSPKTWINTAVSYQFGQSGRTGLDWIDAADPRPDYYSKLPSNANPASQGILRDLFQNNEQIRQINWNNIYQTNYNQPVTTFSNGRESITGKKAQYLLQDRRADGQDLNAYINGETRLTDRLTLAAGIQYRKSSTHNFLVLEDLLGADYHVDIDKFAQNLAPSDLTYSQVDLDNPNGIVKVGDAYGYDYKSHQNNAEAWAQLSYQLPRFDMYVGGKYAINSTYREGLHANGKFPTISKGNSEKFNTNTYDARAGITFKINGRNYIDVNGQYGTKAPLFKNIFISPQTRSQMISNPKNIDVAGGEVSYVLRSPLVKFKITGYYLTLKNQTRLQNFYDEQDIFLADDTLSGGFVTYFLSGIDQVHQGIELGLEYKISPTLKFNLAANYGEYRYTSRFQAQIFEDNKLTGTAPETVYSKNYYVATGPQQVVTAGFNYSAKNFWFLNLNVNYVDQIWVDFNPSRRTAAAIKITGDELQKLEYGNSLYHSIIDQEKLPSAFTVDLFFGKSWKINKNFVRLNIGVNNILNNQFISNGFEQLRYDFDEKNVQKFANKYNYAYGLNYFVNIIYDINSF